MKKVHLEVVGSGDGPLPLQRTDFEHFIDPQRVIFDVLRITATQRFARHATEAQVVVTLGEIDNVLGIAFGTVVDPVQIQRLKPVVLDRERFVRVDNVTMMGEGG